MLWALPCTKGFLRGSSGAQTLPSGAKRGVWPQLFFLHHETQSLASSTCLLLWPDTARSLNVGAVGFAPDLTAGQCQTGSEARNCCSRFSTAFPHPLQLCSWLSTDRLSWLIPASSEHLAVLQVPSTFLGDRATPCSGRPSPSQHHWVGLEHSQPDFCAPLGGDKGDFSIFRVSLMSAAINRAVKITPLCLWVALRC